LSDDAQLRRLQWRCRRGMRELDTLMRRYLDTRWAGADLAEREQFERLLATEDDRLWRWFLRREPVSDPELSDLVERILALPH
jgi:antitoxin CptB